MRIKTYSEALRYIYSKLPIFQRQGDKALKYDLSNIENLCSALGNPQDKFRSIHIAGTNGKGTTSHAIASILQEAGYKTGLYTSPHYKDFRERVKINGDFISKEKLTEFISNNQQIVETLKPSYFELSVAMAFDYFAKEKVDIAVIEVGLGGRLDSTNIINPLLCAITNISFDHMQTLGNTLGEIAVEKAGIIKEKTPVLIGEKQEECQKEYNRIAKEKNAPIYYCDDMLEVLVLEDEISSTKLKIDFLENNIENWELNTLISDLNGPFAKNNIKYAISIASILTKYHKSLFTISHENVIKGLSNIKKNTKYIGRWHVVSQSPLFVADGAHNYGAIKQTLKYIEDKDYSQLHIIIGIVGDKPWEKVMNLLPKNAKYYFTKADIPRAMDEVELKELGAKYNLIGNAYADVHKAKEAALHEANKQDLILLMGSIYLVGEVI